LKIENNKFKKKSLGMSSLLIPSIIYALSLFSNAFCQENYTVTNYFSQRYRDFQMMKISIIPPDGFAKDTNGIGFVDLKNNAAIRAVELHQGVRAASAIFFNIFDSIEHKDSLGMKFLESYNFKINGYEANLVNLSGKVEGDSYIEWRILIGDNSNTYIVTGFIPANKKKILEQHVRSALLSVFYEPDRRLIPPGSDPTTTSSNACGCHSNK
jgi:hypothetical protein